MRRRIAIALAGLVLAAPAGQALAEQTKAPAVAVAAHTCSKGYKHAVIGGSHKCLRRGQYCARSRDREYHKYGYHCHKRDRNGDYHLE